MLAYEGETICVPNFKIIVPAILKVRDFKDFLSYFGSFFFTHLKKLLMIQIYYLKQLNSYQILNSETVT